VARAHERSLTLCSLAAAAAAKDGMRVLPHMVVNGDLTTISRLNAVIERASPDNYTPFKDVLTVSGDLHLIMSATLGLLQSIDAVGLADRAAGLLGMRSLIDLGKGELVRRLRGRCQRRSPSAGREQSARRCLQVQLRGGRVRLARPAGLDGAVLRQTSARGRCGRLGGGGGRGIKTIVLLRELDVRRGPVRVV
jgi:hypothetical protein